MTTTARVDLTGAVVTVLQAQQSATPTLLRAVYVARPGSFPELPAAYIGNADERITYTAGTRTRTFLGLTAVVVDAFSDAMESGTRMDQLVDLLVDRFTAAYATVPGGGNLLQLTGVRDTEVTVEASGGVAAIYRGAILEFAETFIMEGRT